ncbi:MAG: NifB/NifX family molybdenum-iron cluster-binding protein [Desulforhopalus sp.]
MKVMITVRGDFVSPRFDMSSEVIIAAYYDRRLLEEPHSLILSDVSAEMICNLALREDIGVVICGGIEDQHHKFLTWRKITVIDSVIGPHVDALELVLQDKLSSNTILAGVTSREQRV